MKEHSQIFCLIRKEWVAASPEERVRQQLVGQMIHHLGYPFAYIAVEKELRQMPHLALTDNIPDRRIDVVCFAKGIHPQCELYPLLLIECKAVALTSKVMNQVVGYNHYVKAYFLAVANQEEVKVGWYNPSEKKYQFANYLPAYADLLGSVHKPVGSWQTGISFHWDYTNPLLPLPG